MLNYNPLTKPIVPKPKINMLKYNPLTKPKINMLKYNPLTKPIVSKPKIACIMHPDFIKLQKTEVMRYVHILSRILTDVEHLKPYINELSKLKFKTIMNENVLICGYKNYNKLEAPIFESKNIFSINNSNRFNNIIFNNIIFNNSDIYPLAKKVYFMDWHPNNDKENFIDQYDNIHVVNNGKTDIYFNSCDTKLESCYSLYEYFEGYEFEDIKIKKYDCKSFRYLV
ncbi:hypothetical protein Hokovirus_5_17 [Hokovirus HKV1]|uniref:Uncharacterized protein n=1 Tax=Hokovirus HKV1 TaxID=1977638 RepID=A0A1V0SHD4_9VIRU|nr:hypothetical protein Hokovirus_5_17 [Hokovirus HKV1]